MDIAKLVHMANQIGTHFAAEPDPEIAREGIAQHLAAFWAPGMRQSLLDHLDGEGGGDLLPIVREALDAHRRRLAGRRIPA
ncbi:formate dehydrogenase [Parasulfuritortus cantonensis]|uniref:Formate dehydrogenase n=1 Tax=Parasulfuritortus cantonensis TaxID=2528202 RepID=A0A4R1B7Y2_9PROT|nr:formate dehydrogenase subunit delta [Parasulfuritortus cantonensis]TCJ11909.1 formate dehydrogenase [Parasulfuritortus cantonensis]